MTEYDGKGRYRYFGFLYGRTIIPKHVLDIEPGLLDLHDMDNLPFGVEISIKVQVTDSELAAATLTKINHENVKKVVEDTVMSAARSVAMERTILDIMKNREEIEKSMYTMVSDALNKLGLTAVIFDIKNITDVDGKDVIASLERVKIAELVKKARISEATHNNEAREVEIERQKATQVKAENMKLEEEQARLLREKQMAVEQMQLEREQLLIDEQQKTRTAEMERKRDMIQAEADREQKLIAAQAESDAVLRKAEAEANAIKLKAEAEAEGIKVKGIAEVEVLKQKADVLKEGSVTAFLQILQLLANAQVDSAGKIAEALGKNNKILYIPTNGDSNFLANWLPKLDGLLQSDMIPKIIEQLKGNSIKKITAKNKV